MANRKITLLVAAAIIGLGTLAVVHNLMKPEPVVEQQPQAVQAVEIAAAAHDLPTGTILKEVDIKWIPWSPTADTSALLLKGRNNPADIAGAVVRDGFRANEPLVSARIVHPKDQGFLAAVLTPGMRAMSISLSPSAEVAGFIFPGDRVDVILTHSFTRRDVSDLSDRRISETVLQNVRVLALDQRSGNESNDPKVAQIATLELDNKSAEKLSLAADMSSGNGGSKGSLSLILRSLASDVDGIEIKPGATWDSDVSSAYPNSAGDDGLVQRVQVMRGKTITENSFERHR